MSLSYFLIRFFSYTPEMISVIIPTRNRAAALSRCLAQFASNKSEVFELIVVDNNSTDNTAEVIADCSKVSSLAVRHVFERNLGPSHARNAGIRAARYDILAFTDDDCIVADDWLHHIAQAFLGDPDLAVLGGRVELFDPRDFPIAIRLFDDAMQIRTVSDLHARMIGCNVAMRAQVIRQIGAFDTSFGPSTPYPVGEDTDLVYRAFAAGLKIMYSPLVRIRHAHGRRDMTTVDATRLKYARSRGAVVGKYLLRDHRWLLKPLYWEARAHISSMVSHLQRQESADIKVIYAFWTGLLGKLFFSRIR